MNKIKLFLNLSIFKFLYYNFFSFKLKGKILPYKGTIINLGTKSLIDVKGKLNINYGKLKYSKKETLIDIKNEGKFIIRGSYNIFYNTDICVFEGAILVIGSGFMNAGSQIRCKKSIEIGENVAISRGVTIWDTDAHQIFYEDGTKSRVDKKVTIGDNVWIGNNVTILKGVNIGDNVIIGAGSVVNKDIPSNMLAVGNPAKPVKKIKGWK